MQRPHPSRVWSRLLGLAFLLLGPVTVLAASLDGLMTATPERQSPGGFFIELGLIT
jgi:hypothetical protein